MHVLQIGQKAIPYELKRSALVSERRITITPERVEVMALMCDDDEAIAGFLDRKREWVFNTVREMESVNAQRHVVPRFMTGSKIPYRGRMMSLTVRKTDAERMAIAFRNGFIVDLPHWADQNSNELVASELKHWLKQRARRDATEIARKYGNRFGREPRSIRVTDLVHGWGSCGAEGNLVLNWNLIFAPRRVLEYVVVHEIAHLHVRSHGDQFWKQLSMMYPTYQEPMDWLENHGSSLSSEFLDI